MVNKRKQKRRLNKELKRRPRLIKKVEIDKTNRALKNIFIKAGILDG
jgi:hypothetical protein